MQRPLKLPRRKASDRAESKALWNEARDIAHADFFTLGYEGRSADNLVASLKDAGVRTLIDIRFTPQSMYRPELGKAKFQPHIEKAGLTYMHCQELGVPKDIRVRAIESGTRNTIWEWYDRYVVEQRFKSNLHWFMNLEHPIAMMCVEHDPEECHRHRIFVALERNGLRGYDL